MCPRQGKENTDTRAGDNDVANPVDAVELGHDGLISVPLDVEEEVKAD